MRSSSRIALPVLLFWLAAIGPANARVVGLPAWDVAPTPNSGSGESELRGLDVRSTSDVWAVGRRGTRTLTEHWDGSSFTIVRSPNVQDRANVLEDVDGTSATNVWAVGHHDSIESVGSRTLTLHWNGAAWKRFPAPSIGAPSDQNILTGVDAISPSDAWAVGAHSTLDPARSAALTLHWNGTSWASIPNDCGRGLTEVFALSSTAVWAVGGSSTCRWNGATWNRIAAAPPPNPQQFLDLQDVSGTSGNDVWAVGLLASSCGEGQVCHSGAIEHWNGSTWTFLGGGALLYGVRAISQSNVYAVGLGIGPAVLHYDGSEWEGVPQPAPPIQGTLLAVDATATGKLWAAGWKLGSTLRTLAERAPSPTSGALVGTTGVSSATVSWFGPESSSVETDPSGEFDAGGLDAGTYTFTASEAGCTPASKQVMVKAGTTISVSLPIIC